MHLLNYCSLKISNAHNKYCNANRKKMYRLQHDFTAQVNAEEEMDDFEGQNEPALVIADDFAPMPCDANASQQITDGSYDDAEFSSQDDGHA